jgi:hypothetical protein
MARRRRNSKCEEALDSSRVADRIRSDEAEFAENVDVIAVAASATHESFPVVVQRFDAASRWMMLAEGNDLVQVHFERLVELSHGHVVAALGTPQDPP